MRADRRIGAWGWCVNHCRERTQIIPICALYSMIAKQQPEHLVAEPDPLSGTDAACGLGGGSASVGGGWARGASRTTGARGRG
jgi:hypothetical protein